MKKIIVILLLLLLVTSLASCDVVANHMTTGYLCTTELDGSMYMLSRFSKVYKIDFENRTFSLAQDHDFDETLFENKNELKYDFFAGEHSGKIPEGYEGIIGHLEKCKLESDTSVIDACGYANDGILTGFVQVYYDTSGKYGNYAIEKIAHSIAFSYNADTNEFSIVKKFDGVVIVAFANSAVIYWKNKAYYSYDLTTNEEKYLVEDKAYDGGLNQTSIPAVFSNEEICVLHLVKGKAKENIEYMYVFNFETGEFFELEYTK